MDIVLLFGEQGSGKSIAALRCAQKAWLANWRVAGIVAPGEFAENRRHSFTVIDLASGEKTQLAQRDYPSPIMVGPFGFYAEGLELGRTALATACNQGIDLAVVDEIGPLELQGGGWAQGLRNIVDSKVPHLLITVRPHLVEQVAATFFPHKTYVAVYAKEYHKIFYRWDLREPIWQML